MSWLARKPKANTQSYLGAGNEIVAHLFSRLGLSVKDQAYTVEESNAISSFVNEFVAWGKRQAPPLFAVSNQGQIFCIPEIASASLQGYTTSTALQKLYRSGEQRGKRPQERLATALRAWISHMDSGVLSDMIPILTELGWQDEVYRVSQVLRRFPPHESDKGFLALCKSLLVIENDPPPNPEFRPEIQKMPTEANEKGFGRLETRTDSELTPEDQKMLAEAGKVLKSKQPQDNSFLEDLQKFIKEHRLDHFEFPDREEAERLMKERTPEEQKFWELMDKKWPSRG